uniref:Uncharacterized protein n=1 Tax=Setaria viridis TaxID=4556 RepID=A0A4U6T3Q3_SETVI|nr:hypothetical protein SEVIR_9G379466v2 [Setaria viridis]
MVEFLFLKFILIFDLERWCTIRGIHSLRCSTMSTTVGGSLKSV